MSVTQSYFFSSPRFHAKDRRESWEVGASVSTCLWKVDYGALSVYPLLAIIMLAKNSEDQSVFHQRCEEQPQCLFCENPRHN